MFIFVRSVNKIIYIILHICFINYIINEFITKIYSLSENYIQAKIRREALEAKRRLKEYRKNKKTVLMADENLVKIADEKNQNETTQDQLEKRQNLEQLYELIKNHLSKKEQNLIALKYFQEKSYQEIGEILNINVNSVGVKLHRIINKMKKHLI